MTEKPDRLMDEVRAALDVTPASSFEARVRRRTASERMGEAGWRWAGAALIAGAVVVVLVAVATRPDVPRSSTAAPSASESLPEPATPVPVIQTGPPARAAAAVPTEPRTIRVRASHHVRADEPVVLISPDQAVAVEQLLASVWARRTVYPADRQRFDPESGDLLPPESIEVAPIAMAALSYDTPNEVNR